MLKNILSSYFAMNLFLYLDEKVKLQIIKINKRIQNKLNISILNYKLFSKKYVVFDTNKKMQKNITFIMIN